MNFRKMITLIELLSVTGVVSVGFSTWVIVETEFPEVQVQVETENVINTNEYLEIKNVIFSDYDENGFYKDYIYSDDTTIGTDTSGRTLTGYLEFDIEVDLSKCSYISGDIDFEIGLLSSNGSFDIIAKSSVISRESSTYVISNSTSGSIASKNPIEKDEYNVSVSGVTVVKYKVSDSFTISESNRTSILLVHLKYGFTLTASDISTLVTLNNYNQGITFNITSILREGVN